MKSWRKWEDLKPNHATVLKKRMQLVAANDHGFSWEKLDAVLQMGASKTMAAGIMDCSIDTVLRRVKEKYDITFAEYRESKLSVTKIKLQQKAIQLGLAGNSTMLIFSLKNLCCWRDKQPDEESITINNFNGQSDEDLNRRLQELSKKNELEPPRED